MTENTPALVFDRVTVRYPGVQKPALENLSLKIARGEKAALMGLNGSGKTTLLMAAAGLLVFEGSIEVDGVALTPKSAGEVRERIGFLFAHPADQLLFPKVVDDVGFSLVRRRLSKEDIKSGALKALQNFGAEDLASRSPFELSHGQKARVALAGATVTAPPVLLLDEPSAGLDPPGRRQLIESLKACPAAFLAATHNLDFARRACGRCVLLEKGRLVNDDMNLGELAKRWEE